MSVKRLFKLIIAQSPFMTIITLKLLMMNNVMKWLFATWISVFNKITCCNFIQRKVSACHE